jgi:hypothetical protein
MSAISSEDASESDVMTLGKDIDASPEHLVQHEGLGEARTPRYKL